MCVHVRRRFAVEESNEFNDTMLFIKWLPDVEEPACRFHLDFSFTCLETGTGTGKRVCVWVCEKCVDVDVTVTRSRLSTSALKPEIMGTSMTAMLDEPEWSHLDRKLRLGPIRIARAHVLGVFTWHRSLMKCGNPVYLGVPPGRHRLWAPTASGSAPSGCRRGFVAVWEDGGRRRKTRAARAAPGRAPSGPP